MCQIVAIVGEAFALKTLVIITSGMLAAAEGVRFRSKADMCSAKCDVRFTPNSDRRSGRKPATPRPP